MLKNIVNDRTVTSTGVSIGTGLALETLFDVKVYDTNRSIPDRVDPNSYKTHIFNIYTLFRNVVSSIVHKDKEQLISSKLVQEQLINDMYILIELYKSVDTKLVFYMPDYTQLYKKYNNGKPDTAYRPYITHLYIKKNLKGLKYPGTVYSGGNRGLLPSTYNPMLLMSHFTLDLIGVSNLSGVSLLESHTGKVKTKREFGPKYHPIGKRDLSILPMDSKLLYILGDKSIVKPMSIVDRRSVYELTVTGHINPESSPVKVASLIKKSGIKVPVL